MDFKFQLRHLISNYPQNDFLDLQFWHSKY
jgi:hypothetical protein